MQHSALRSFATTPSPADKYVARPGQRLQIALASLALFVSGSLLGLAAGAQEDDVAPPPEISEEEKRKAELENGMPDEEPQAEPEQAPDLGPPEKPFHEAGNPERQADADDAKSSEDEDKFGHGFQFGIRVGGTLPYRIVFRYDDSPFCKEPEPGKEIKDQQKFCGHMGPAALDVGLSFALLDSIEPFLWGRFGLAGEPETNTQELLVFGVGARIYTMSDSAFKIFVEPAVAMELEKGAGNDLWATGGNLPGASDYNPEYKQDLLVHVAVGPQYDFAKQFGAYFSLGMTVGMLRYIHASMEGSVGVQLRVP